MGGCYLVSNSHFQAMTLKLRILTQNGQSVSAASTTEELLAVIQDRELGVIILNHDEEDSLRGWLLLRAQELAEGTFTSLDEEKTICIGKTVDGRPFVRDASGDWPTNQTGFWLRIFPINKSIGIAIEHRQI